MIEWIGLGAIVLVGIILIMLAVYYNRFVLLSNRIDNSLSQIDVQLKKRADLVPNLVESVKGYMKHEKSIIKEVTEARKALVGAKDLTGRMKAGANLQNALKSIFALSENYPQLKANENFLQLQNEMSTIEEKIAYARQFYNDATLSYNNSVKTFPGMFFASMFGKSERTYLEIPQEEKAVPKLKFD